MVTKRHYDSVAITYDSELSNTTWKYEFCHMLRTPLSFTFESSMCTGFPAFLVEWIVFSDYLTFFL